VQRPDEGELVEAFVVGRSMSEAEDHHAAADLNSRIRTAEMALLRTLAQILERLDSGYETMLLFHILERQQEQLAKLLAEQDARDA
jgi:hypothetical protein